MSTQNNIIQKAAKNSSVPFWLDSIPSPSPFRGPTAVLTSPALHRDMSTQTHDRKQQIHTWRTSSYKSNERLFHRLPSPSPRCLCASWWKRTVPNTVRRCCASPGLRSSAVRDSEWRKQRVGPTVNSTQLSCISSRMMRTKSPTWKLRQKKKEEKTLRVLLSANAN